MKPQLPCCEIYAKWRVYMKTFVECDHCNCVFARKELLNDHNRKIHKTESTGKRKLKCCKQNEKKRQKFHQHQCDYCECTFQKKYELQNHVNFIHKCRTCYQIVLTEDIRIQHEVKHEADKRKKEESEKLHKQRDDDLVMNYVKTDKLDEYQPDPDYEPDEYYIFNKFYDLNKEEMLKLVKKFDLEGILNGCDIDRFTCNEIIYLLENDALTIEDVTSFLDSTTYSLGYDKISSELVTYFLDKDYEIKREWVAKVINDNALIERIKQKYTYTFDEVYEARQEQSFYDQRYWDEFYVQVHKHFPNPEFEDPFADPFIDFKCVATEHVQDYLHKRYFYNEDDEELSIVVGSGDNECDISLGGIKEMLERNLPYLIQEYNEAIEEYRKSCAEIDECFKEREKELNAALTENHKQNIKDHYHDVLHKEYLSERNHMANVVSKLYFVIAQK